MKKIHLTIILVLYVQFANAQFDKDIFPVDTTNSDYSSETGQFIKYYENGQIEIEGTLRYGVLHDSCTFFYENGKLYQKGPYYYGKPIGTWREYTKKQVELMKTFSHGPDESRKPKNIVIKKEVKDEYIFNYPSSWIIVARNTRGVDFFLFPWDVFGQFKDNMNIGKMPIRKEIKKHSDFVKKIKDQYKVRYPNFDFHTEQETKISGIKATDLIAEINMNGTSLTSWTRCFVTKEYAYQIAMTCETSQLERRRVDFEEMLEQFKLNL